MMMEQRFAGDRFEPFEKVHPRIRRFHPVMPFFPEPILRLGGQVPKGEGSRRIIDLPAPVGSYRKGDPGLGEAMGPGKASA